MIKFLLSIGLVCFTLSFMLLACEKGEDETKISSHNSSESHKVGDDCMKCHKSGGEGEGWFDLAGSVYNSAGNSVFSIATVKLYDGPIDEGNVINVVEVDAKGNFYTTEDIDFGEGLYVSVMGNEEIPMNSKITTGACNSCHGKSTDQIWVR